MSDSIFRLWTGDKMREMMISNRNMRVIGPGHDASTLLQVGECYLRSDMPDALTWLWTVTSIDPADARATRRAARICGFFELVAALYRHGMLPGPLLFDWLTVGPAWDRLNSYALEQRRCNLDPTLWAGFESLAAEYKRATGLYAT